MSLPPLNSKMVSVGEACPEVCPGAQQVGKEPWDLQLHRVLQAPAWMVGSSLEEQNSGTIRAGHDS